MNFPKWHETFIPILDVLQDRKVIHYRELLKKVRDKHYGYLPEELLQERLKSGYVKILNRIGFGKSALKISQLVTYPERGFVQITDKGLKALHKGTYTLEDLQKDPEFIRHEEQKNKIKKHTDTITDEDDATPEDMIEAGILDIETEVKAELLEKLKGIDPYYFEKVVLQLLAKMGYGEFKETPKSGDKGIDGVVNQDTLGIEKIYIQAKRYSENKVRETDIRNFIGAMSGDTSKGVFVTTSSFDENAEQKAKEAHHNIILIDRIKLIDLMYTYGVGVQIKDEYQIKQLDEDFFEG